jgi:hypothetical protein
VTIEFSEAIMTAEDREFEKLFSISQPKELSINDVVLKIGFLNHLVTVCHKQTLLTSSLIPLKDVVFRLDPSPN